MRNKYNSEEERKKARTIQNREAKRRQRLNEKLNRKPLVSIKKIPVIVNKVNSYNDDLYTYCMVYPFSESITLTNKTTVTLNMHDKAVEALIKWLSEEGIISNYIKTNEYYGGNYHTHLVVQINKWGIKLRGILEEKWGSGFFRVVHIQSNTHRLNAIRYCFKQIDVASYSDLLQSLADTWSISLTQTFEQLKEANLRRLEEFKVAQNIVTHAKYILKKNGGTK